MKFSLMILTLLSIFGGAMAQADTAATAPKTLAKNLMCAIDLAKGGTGDASLESHPFKIALKESYANFSLAQTVKSDDGRLQIQIWASQPKTANDGASDYVGIEIDDLKLGTASSSAESNTSRWHSNVDDADLDYSFDGQLLTVNCQLVDTTPNTQQEN